MADFPNNLRAWREERELTLQEVADATGIPYSTIANHETGKTDPGPERRRIYCQFYGKQEWQLTAPLDSEPFTPEPDSERLGLSDEPAVWVAPKERTADQVVLAKILCPRRETWTLVNFDRGAERRGFHRGRHVLVDRKPEYNRGDVVVVNALSAPPDGGPARWRTLLRVYDPPWLKASTDDDTAEWLMLDDPEGRVGLQGVAVGSYWSADEQAMADLAAAPAKDSAA